MIMFLSSFNMCLQSQHFVKPPPSASVLLWRRKCYLTAVEDAGEVVLGAEPWPHASFILSRPAGLPTMRTTVCFVSKRQMKDDWAQHHSYWHVESVNDHCSSVVAVWQQCRHGPFCWSESGNRLHCVEQLCHRVVANLQLQKPANVKKMPETLTVTVTCM